MENTDIGPLEKARAALADKEAAAQRHQENANKAEREAEELRTVIKWLEAMERGENSPKANRMTKSQHAADHACQTLDSIGPQRISDLTNLYIIDGGELAGKTGGDQRVTLSGLLGRDPRLKYYKAFGKWWFADRPYPEPQKPSAAEIAYREQRLEAENE